MMEWYLYKWIHQEKVGTSELPYLNILLDDIFGREFYRTSDWKKRKLTCKLNVAKWKNSY